MVRVMLIRDAGSQEGPAITCPAEADHYVAYLRDLDREHFVVLLLDARNHVLNLETVSIGSLSASIVHPREVFKSAILTSAAAIICAHNHPSGDLTPSRDDIDLAKRMLQAGEIIGIGVLDFLVVGPQVAYEPRRMYSMKEAGLIN